jgi:hypothetical protein
VDLAPSWSPAATNPRLKAVNPGTWNLQPPVMISHGIRAGWSTSTVEVESGICGRCATGRF